MTQPFCPPPFRPALHDERLQRPDWTRPAGRDGRLRLDKNENTDLALRVLIGNLLAALPPEAALDYPDAAPVYAKLAAHLGLSPSALLFTAGSDGAIRTAYEAFLEPGDTVLMTAPSFAMYPVYARMFGARIVAVDYQPGPLLGMEKLLAAVAEHHPRLVCLPNPDSPTGSVLSLDALDVLAQAVGREGGALLVDEAYHPFCKITALPLIDRHPHLMVARTFAKAWGLAGARIGCLVATPTTTALLHKLRPMYEVNAVGLALLDRLLDHADTVMAAVDRILDGKAWFLDQMAGRGFPVLRGEGNFLHVAFGDQAPRVHAALADKVLYRPDFSEPCLAGFSRFTAAPQSVLEPVASLVFDSLARNR
ncbi:pyridoxal phosphate-dependent aminotransferase [Pararhodospirillum oryzae]|uniref:Aminotransferase class I/classII large domain-containing protein n=1 Tax=Pararhodospirillum oryzae TaxID=478448 RepID=A0A512H9Q2_9PROT|nr:histidinol-phosphate transaminase [Pararhodospirillum oryzae]GEO82175.1 hypothetical protein ROR02_23060 [Pararhodospirillum oryzae]